jgi:hypothetical protein
VSLLVGGLVFISSTSHQRDLVTDSLYQDVTFYNKAKTLPRTSTRTDLNGNKSSGSSMEARRSSMPDMVSVGLITIQVSSGTGARKSFGFVVKSDILVQAIGD